MSHFQPVPAGSIGVDIKKKNCYCVDRNDICQDTMQLFLTATDGGGGFSRFNLRGLIMFSVECKLFLATQAY